LTVTVRYRREGLRVVRVPTPAPPEALRPAVVEERPSRRTSSPEGAFPQATGDQPVPSARAPSVAAGAGGAGADDYHIRLHRFAVEMRGAVRRYRRSCSWGDTPRTRPPSAVTPEQLKAARTVAGLTQREVADRLGISRGQVAEAESGRRYVNTRLGDWAAGVLEGEDG
jgi:hypothetical protein